MLLPDEFEHLYGVPLVKVYTVTDAIPLIIPYNPYRYLLGFVKCFGSMIVLPLGADVTAYTTADFTSASLPVIYTHALHGAYVNMQWRVRNTVSPSTGTISIVEGLMIDISKRKRSKLYANYPVAGNNRASSVRTSSRRRK